MTDKEKVAAAQAIKKVRDNWPMLLEQITISARLAKAKYDALLKEGFTSDQALELCKTL